MDKTRRNGFFGIVSSGDCILKILGNFMTSSRMMSPNQITSRLSTTNVEARGCPCLEKLFK